MWLCYNYYVKISIMAKNKIDIISISHLFYPNVGGLEKTVYELLKTFSKKGLKPHAIYAGAETKKQQFENFTGQSFKTISLFNGTYPIPGIKFALEILNKIRKNPNSIILVHDRHLLTSLLAVVICFLTRRKYILISHTTNSSFFKIKALNGLGNFLDKYVFKFVVRMADQVIAVSKANQKYLAKIHGIKPDKVHVIYNGFDENIVNSIKFDLNKKEKIVIFATKWIQVKNPDLTALAFRKLAKRYPSWTFKFIGKGDSVASHFKNHYKNLEIIEEFYSHKELFKLLSKSSIYINSSQQEGLSLGVVEAAALGNIPVISDAPGNLDIANELETNEFVFERNNLNSIIEKIEDAMKFVEESHLEIEKRESIELMIKIAHKVFSGKEIKKQYLNFINYYLKASNNEDDFINKIKNLSKIRNFNEN